MNVNSQNAYYQPETIVFHDGNFEKAQKVTTNPYSQSIHYGNAVVEGLRAYSTPQGSQIFRGIEHFQRFVSSAEKMHLKLPYTAEKLLQITYELLEVNNLEAAYIRPLAYSSPNMEMQPADKTHLMIAAWQWANYLGNDALDVMISSFQRPAPFSTYLEAKIAGNYVSSILATTEAKKQGYDEAILVDAEGFVAEGSASNIFIEKNGKLCTPPKGTILPGITRATVLDITEQLGIDIEEKRITPGMLREADGAFLTATAIEITGIKSVDGKVFTKDWTESIGYEIRQKYKQLVLLGEYDNYSII